MNEHIPIEIDYWTKYGARAAHNYSPKNKIDITENWTHKENAYAFRNGFREEYLSIINYYGNRHEI